MKFELNAQKRTQQGSGASRRLRRAQKVPGILYGGNEAPVLIELDHNEIFLAIRKEGFASSVLTIKLDDQEIMALLRDAQIHPYKRQIMHIDFLRVNAAQTILQKIPFRFINADQAPGIKVAGGIASYIMNEVMVSCLPKDLPQFITVDLKDLAAGKTIHLSDIQFPDNVKVIIPAKEDPVIVSISAKKSAEEATDADAGSESPSTT